MSRIELDTQELAVVIVGTMLMSSLVTGGLLQSGYLTKNIEPKYLSYGLDYEAIEQARISSLDNSWVNCSNKTLWFNGNYTCNGCFCIDFNLTMRMYNYWKMNVSGVEK